MRTTPRLCIVDDEPDITTVLKTGLERRGFTVKTYNDPKLALLHFKARLYDVVILDIRMPKMSGLELYREIVKIDRTQKALFFTAFEIWRKEFVKVFPELEVGAVFLQKPIGVARLVSAITDVLSAMASPLL